MMKSFCKFAPFVVLVLLAATSSKGSLNVQTAKFEDLYNDSLVVTNVIGSGGEGGEIDTNVVRTIAGESVVGFLTETNVSDLSSSAQPSSIVSRVSNDSVGFDIEDDKLKLVEDGKVIWELTSNSIDTNIVKSIVRELTPEIVTNNDYVTDRFLDTWTVKDRDGWDVSAYVTISKELDAEGFTAWHWLWKGGDERPDGWANEESTSIYIGDQVIDRTPEHVDYAYGVTAIRDGVLRPVNKLGLAYTGDVARAVSESRSLTDMKVYLDGTYSRTFETQGLPSGVSTVGNPVFEEIESLSMKGWTWKTSDGYSFIAEADDMDARNLHFEDPTGYAPYSFNAVQTIAKGDPIPTDDTLAKKSEVDQISNRVMNAISAAVSDKADRATTIEGYGIKDAYTKVETDTSLLGKEDVGTCLPITGGLVCGFIRFDNKGILIDDDPMQYNNWARYRAYFFDGEHAPFAQTLPEYLAYGEWNTASDPFAKVSQIPVVSETDPTFSNAVLAVRISTNDFAALYELKEAFDDMPIDPVTGGISIGALIVALASAAAWLKKNKRDKDDLAVYEEKTGPWTHGKLVEGYEITEEQPQHDSSLWFWYGAWSDESGGHYTSVAQAPFVSEDQTNIVFTVNAHPSGVPSGFTFTATRTTSIGTKPNQQLAAVATGDTQTPADGDLMKYDATNDRLVKAVVGTDYIADHQDISGKQDKILETGILKGGGDGAILPAMPSSSAGELADYRDPTDNTCHKTTSVAGEWSTVTKDGDVWSVYRHDTSDRIEYILQRNGKLYPNSSTKYDGDDTATSLTWVRVVDWDKDFDITFTRTLTTIASKGHTFVTEDNVHSKGVREDGSPADQELHDFFGESNGVLNGRLSYERNATGLKDRAFNALAFDGTEYNLSTALSAVTPTASGQPRDLLIVATATAATTISFTAGTIKGDKPTIDGVGKWLITLTEFESGVWYCRQIKMEDAQ